MRLLVTSVTAQGKGFKTHHPFLLLSHSVHQIVGHSRSSVEVFVPTSNILVGAHKQGREGDTKMNEMFPSSLHHLNQTCRHITHST